MDKTKKRIIPKKNYFLLGLLCVVTILILYGLVNWYQTREKYRLGLSVISSIISEVKEDELSNYLLDNPNTVIYFSSSKDEEIKTFEKELKNYISEKNLRNQMVYVNTSDIEKTSFYSSFVNNYFSDDLKRKGVDLRYIPNMVVLKDGKVYAVLITYKNAVSLEEVERFLEKNEVVEK